MTSLHAASNDVRDFDVLPMGSGVRVRAKITYGVHTDFAVATRWPDYHSSPHTDSGTEQLNYAISGETWIYIEDEAFLLKKGDFLRIPADATHWAWNRSNEPATLLETHSPLQTLNSDAHQVAVPLFDPREQIQSPLYFDSMRLDTEIHRMDLAEGADPSNSGFYRAADAFQETSTLDEGVRAKITYGARGDLMEVTRPPGYHGKPSVHDCEQYNYCLAGEILIYVHFIDNRVYHLKQGDFLRIPANAIHWAWNNSDGPNTLIEAHYPGLHDDPLLQGKEALFNESEPLKTIGSTRCLYLHPESFVQDEAEKQAEAISKRLDLFSART